MSSMKARLILAGALVVAALSVVAVLARGGRRLPGPGEARARRYIEARAELERAQTRRDGLRGDVEKLRKAQKQLRDSWDASAPAPSDEGADWVKRMSALTRNMLMMQVESTMAELERRLKLSPEQKSRVEKLLAENAEASADFRSGSENDGEAELRASLSLVLSAPQMEAYDAYRREEDARMEKLRRTHLLSKLSEELGLDVEQSKAAQAAIAADPSLERALEGSLEARTPEEVEAWIERTRVDRRKLAAALQPSLSSAQILKLEELLARREQDARELAGWLRLFADEGGRR